LASRSGAMPLDNCIILYEDYQIRLTILHLSTSSSFHFFPFLPATATLTAVGDLGETGEVYSGKSSASWDKYSVVCLLYS
jgi:hypothetical protein